MDAKIKESLAKIKDNFKESVTEAENIISSLIKSKEEEVAKAKAEVSDAEKILDKIKKAAADNPNLDRETINRIINGEDDPRIQSEATIKAAHEKLQNYMSRMNDIVINNPVFKYVQDISKTLGNDQDLKAFREVLSMDSTINEILDGAKTFNERMTTRITEAVKNLGKDKEDGDTNSAENKKA